MKLSGDVCGFQCIRMGISIGRNLFGCPFVIKSFHLIYGLIKIYEQSR